MPVNINGSTGVSAVQSGVTLSNPIFTGANTANGVFTGTSSFTGNVAVSGANSYININGSNVSPFTGMMKNRIINGDMRIDQRYAGTSNTINSNAQYQYNLDRWYFLNYTGGVFTVQQMNSSNSSVSNYEAGSAPTGFLNSTKMVVSTANSSIAATSFCRILQTIEGINIADLDFGKSTAKSVTLSFWVKSSLTGSYTATILNALGNRVNPQQYTINAANTWEYKTITYTGDTTGTWWINNTQGLYVDFWLAGGSSYVTSSPGWNSSNYYEITGQSNWLATVGNTFYITGVQLEVGTVATPFEFRQYGTELALCQRYFQKSYDVGTIPGTATRLGIHGIGGLYGAGSCINGLTFRTSMRTAPTVTIYDGAGTTGVVSLYSAGSWTDNSGNVRALNTSENGFNCNYGYVSNPWTTGQPGNCHWKAEAEI